MSNHSFTRDDVNLTDYSNDIKFMLFLGNAKERYDYTCNSVTHGISFESSHCISFITLCANCRLPCISITQNNQRK